MLFAKKFILLSSRGGGKTSMKNARLKLVLKPLIRAWPFALSCDWPLKNTMDQESMTAFVFIHIGISLGKNPNSSSLALSDTLMGKTLNFYPAYPKCDHSSFQGSGCIYLLTTYREHLRTSFNQIKFSREHKWHTKIKNVKCRNCGSNHYGLLP